MFEKTCRAVCSGRQRAFTLVELLVVIAIIGILIALLLPAVQAAREAARRSQCTNNLKQIGLALHNYHDTYKVLPSARCIKYVGTALSGTAWGWGMFILPFIEQQSLHDTISTGNPSLWGALSDPAKQPVMQQPLSAFRCPSDIAPEVNTQRTFNYYSQTLSCATSNYVGSSSSDIPLGDSPSDAEYAGVFQGQQPVPFAKVLDGTSNTVAVGERAWQYRDNLGARQLAKAAIVYGIASGGGSTAAGIRWGDTLGAGVYKLDLNGTSQPDTATIGYNRGEHCYFSEHPGGANFVLCDGSVRFVSSTIEGRFNEKGVALDPSGSTNAATRAIVDTTWERILARADQQAISGQW